MQQPQAEAEPDSAPASHTLPKEWAPEAPSSVWDMQG